MPEPNYRIFVNNQEIHACTDWYEAHDLYVKAYGIDEWSGYAIYTSLDGNPIWGNTPEQQADPAVQRRLSVQRRNYLKTVEGTSEQEREQAAREKFAALVAETRAKLAELQRKEGESCE